MMPTPDLALMLGSTAEWLLIASLKTVPLIIFILVIQRLFRKHLSAAAQHLLWLSVLMSLSIPFGWKMHLEPISSNNVAASIPHTEQSAEISNNPLSVIDIQHQTDIPTTDAIPYSTAQQTAKGFGGWQTILREHYRVILSMMWLSGVLGFLCLTLVRARYFDKLKNNAATASPEVFAVLNSCKTELDIHKSISLLSSHEIQSPITLGWWKPAIVLPHQIENQLTSENLKHILLHELGHIKRHDIFFNWSACLINILHWFNPIVWLACRRMRMDMEVACDALVLSHLDQSQRKNYGATLIEISEIPRVSPRAITTLGILENHTELKERLKMIKQFTTMNIKNTVFFGVILMTTTITSLAQPATQSTSQPAVAVKAKAELHSESTLTLTEFAARAEKDLNMKVLVGQKDAGKNIQANIGNEQLNYGQLLTQLKINQFTAYKSKDYIQIVPIDDARFVSIPVVEKNKTYYEDEVVTDYLKTKNACASRVGAAIRPIIPIYGHLTIHEKSNTLIIIDTYGNIQRIKATINSLEEDLDAPEDCTDIPPPPENHPQTKTNK